MERDVQSPVASLRVSPERAIRQTKAIHSPQRSQAYDRPSWCHLQARAMTQAFHLPSCAAGIKCKPNLVRHQPREPWGKDAWGFAQASGGSHQFTEKNDCHESSHNSHLPWARACVTVAGLPRLWRVLDRWGFCPNAASGARSHP